jgi:hypothetical protein
MKFFLLYTTATKSPDFKKVSGFSFWAKKARTIEIARLLINFRMRSEDRPILEHLPKLRSYYLFRPDARKRAVIALYEWPFLILQVCTVGLLYVQSEHGTIIINQL